MSEKAFDLEGYLSNGVENIVKGALKASLHNPKESVFMAKYALASKKATKKRHDAEKEGEHIPPFLIASITSSCNLHCAGCYSRGIDSCSDVAPVAQLDGETWGKVFKEAADLGTAIIIVAGGEPLLRKDVITQAAAVPDILFPVITNGTMLKDDYLVLFDKNRNLVPVLSIEGNEETTDRRRGAGVYKALNQTMDTLREKGIIFGTSITVTTENMQEVFAQEFVDGLYQKGCKLIIYVEYVPVAPNTGHLAPGDAERDYMSENLWKYREKYEDMVFVSFPGDEKSSDGCLAAGRGFFHINSHGGAEPCPFSPFSDCNVKDVGVRGAMHSHLFEALTASDLLTQEHDGSCVLYGKDEQVEALL